MLLKAFKYFLVLQMFCACQSDDTSLDTRFDFDEIVLRSETLMAFTDNEEYTEVANSSAGSFGFIRDSLLFFSLDTFVPNFDYFELIDDSVHIVGSAFGQVFDTMLLRSTIADSVLLDSTQIGFALTYDENENEVSFCLVSTAFYSPSRDIGPYLDLDFCTTDDVNEIIIESIDEYAPVNRDSLGIYFLDYVFR